MTVTELSEMLGLEAVCCPCPEKQVTGGYAGDLLSWVMGRANSGDAWITIMSNINVIAVATLADTAVVILAEGVGMEESTVQTAFDKGVNIFKTDKPVFETAAAVFKALEK